MIFYDTIIAQSTPVGKGGIGIIRISGIDADKAAIMVLGKIPIPRYATFSLFKDNKKNVLDEGIAIWFPAPYSFTGENILELQGHGSPIILDLLIKTISSIPGIRIAKPGEFSERAFLNEKLDLIQAEAISDLINANSEKSIQLSLRSMKGEFSKYIYQLVKKINNIQLKVEGSINFIELEDIKLSKNYIYKKLLNILNDCNIIHKQARQGSVLKEGIKVVIVGQPNAGKSSLFNQLCADNKAIVTNIKGTTRDVLHEYINIKNIIFHLVDTAGLRNPTNEIEKIGIDLSWKEIYNSDHILFVIDGSMNFEKQSQLYLKYVALFPKNINVSIIINKNDLFLKKNNFFKNKNNLLYLSSLTGEGIEALNQHLLKTHISNIDNTESLFLARRRHLNILNEIYLIILNSKKNWILSQNLELLAENLNIVKNKLNEITGVVKNKNILDEIFSKFCIGK
ncbi:tRNA modification GTPase MnmE [Buchnera aphidicola (Eriosoma grossulariae)]|uniref:tRNA uridine-5-carboxymethylaminomethyl(34) synthesis GTPase MnmE n=1 Tax=Buchnera aphidicola TaxID=9 RepID=UPI003463CE35